MLGEVSGGAEQVEKEGDVVGGCFGVAQGVDSG